MQDNNRRGRDYDAPKYYDDTSSMGYGRPQEAAFDVDGFTRDLMDKFIDDTTAIAQEHDQHKREMTTRLDDFERAHMRHKIESTGDDQVSIERRNLHQKINDKNLDFEDFTRETTQTKKQL